MTTTTHKTLRGPRGAIILSREKYAKDLARAVFPGAQGGPHDHTTAAKAIAFAEALTPEFRMYGEQVIKNAQELARHMMEYGARIVSGGTDNHLFCIDVATSYSIGGKQAELLLEEIGISVNKNMIPFDMRKPLDPSGIRIGTPAVTTRGMKIPEMQVLATIVHQSLGNPLNADLQKNLALQVRALCDRFPIYQ